MKLKEILRQHELHQPHIIRGKGSRSSQYHLGDNLGDGFLLKHNPIYKGVRLESLRLGYRYQPKRFYDYDVLALTQLNQILAQKQIPYCDNVNCLKEIEKKAPSHFKWADIPPLRSNYVLHESAHGVARNLREAHIPLKIPMLARRKMSVKAERDLALVLLIEEAFANACESFANVYSVTELHDEFLYKNSYIMEKESKRKQMRTGIQWVGEADTFKLLFFSFLYANFVKTDSAGEGFTRVMKIVFGSGRGFGKKATLDLRNVFKVGFDLDPAFTIFTNAFCLRLMGIQQELFTLLAFDFLAYFESDARYSQLLNTMAKSATSSVESKRKK